MKQLIKQTVRRLVQLKGFELEYSTEREKVTSLIESLHPYDVGKNLIRLGPNGDGGYLVPDDLEGIDACFSPGVGEICGFEKACSERDMKVFMADASVEGPEICRASEQFYFIKKYIGAFSSENKITMDDWVNSAGLKQASDLLLQMDIEGAEYQAILSMSDDMLKRFRIIVIEFHTLDKLWNRHFFEIASSAFSKILQNHTAVHIHPNNYRPVYRRSGVEIPRYAEFTFIRNDRVDKKNPRTAFPHPLDFDNKPNPGFPLPANWFKAD